MEWVFIWLACGVIAGIIGAQKGAGCASFAFGVLLGPIGVIIVLVSPGNRVKCPFCQKYIDPQAKVCPYCQSHINSNTLGGNYQLIDGKWKKRG
jgi:hypothetical protein